MVDAEPEILLKRVVLERSHARQRGDREGDRGYAGIIRLLRLPLSTFAATSLSSWLATGVNDAPRCHIVGGIQFLEVVSFRMAASAVARILIESLRSNHDGGETGARRPAYLTCSSQDPQSSINRQAQSQSDMRGGKCTTHQPRQTGAPTDALC